MIEMTQTLMAKGFAYATDLAIYFDISRAKDYTKLSGQKLEKKLSPVIEAAPMIGWGRVSRKFHASHARTAVLPGPVQAFMHRRFERGNLKSASSCQASGSTPKSSRTIRAGFSRHAAMRSAAGCFTVW